MATVWLLCGYRVATVWLRCCMDVQHVLAKALLLLDEIQLCWRQMRRHGVGVRQMWVVPRHQQMQELKRQTRTTAFVTNAHMYKRNF